MAGTGSKGSEERVGEGGEQGGTGECFTRVGAEEVVLLIVTVAQAGWQTQNPADKRSGRSGSSLDHTAVFILPSRKT